MKRFLKKYRNRKNKNDFYTHNIEAVSNNRNMLQKKINNNNEYGKNNVNYLPDDYELVYEKDSFPYISDN